MKVAIIIINFNGEEDTIQCLQSLEALNFPKENLLTIVVDNGSKKKFELPKIKLEIGELHVLDTGENLGFAGGNNFGIEYAMKNGADYIMLLNNDTYVEKNLVKELFSAFQAESNVGIIAPKIYFAKGFEFHKNNYAKEDLGKVFWYAGGIMDWKNVIGRHRGVDEVDNGQYEKIEDTDFATGCCFFTSVEVLQKVGVLDEKLFLYYEENDLCQRVKKYGYRIIYAPKAILWHKNAQSTGGSGSALQDYFITRNRLWFGMRYASLRAKTALIREGLRLLFFGRKWQKVGVFDFFLGKFGKGSYAV
jgi:GT2 family glycosyltransferase